jgi:hypothetical protein
LDRNGALGGVQYRNPQTSVSRRLVWENG